MSHEIFLASEQLSQACVGTAMDDQLLLEPSSWQDWLTVGGYLTFTLFIVWRILTSR